MLPVAFEALAAGEVACDRSGYRVPLGGLELLSQAENIGGGKQTSPIDEREGATSCDLRNARRRKRHIPLDGEASRHAYFEGKLAAGRS